MPLWIFTSANLFTPVVKFTLQVSMVLIISIIIYSIITQLAGAVEYTNCTSVERQDPLNVCPGYDTKKSDGKVPVMLDLWGMRSTSSLPSLPGPLRPGVAAPKRVLSMGQIELNRVLMLN